MKKQQGLVVKIFNNTISTCATAVGCPDYAISFRDGDEGGDELHCMQFISVMG